MNFEPNYHPKRITARSYTDRISCNKMSVCIYQPHLPVILVVYFYILWRQVFGFLFTLFDAICLSVSVVR